jgi:uncharacterized protein
MTEGRPSVSAQNVEVVRAALDSVAEVDAFSPTAASRLLAVCHPNVEWDVSALWPDGTVYRGRSGVVRFFRRWLGAWESYDFEVEELLDKGEHVVVIMRERGTAKGTGAKVDHRFAQIWTLRHGRVIRWRACPGREEALAVLRRAQERD